jgi:hypothetical protein
MPLQRKGQKTVVKDGENCLRRPIPAETAPFGRKLLECMENRCAAKKRSTRASGATIRGLAKVAKKKPGYRQA